MKQAARVARITHIARVATLAALTGPLLAVPAAVAAQTTAPAVAVMVFNLRARTTDAATYDGIGTAIADLMGAELAARAKVRVVGGDQVRQAISAERLPRGGTVDRDAAVKIGRQLGAQHVVYGAFAADAAGNVRLDARGVNVSTGAVEFTERMQDHADNIVALVGRLAGRLSTGMSLPAGGGSAGLSPVPLRSLVSYGRALDLASRGSGAQAAELLGTVVKESPGFAPAKAALARVKTAP